jgi:putative tricarboxylic transport membrane protein
MLFFGFIGFILRELKFPMAPLILGLVLGDLLEKNLTRGLVLSGGSLVPFFTRPVCAALAAITILSILWSIPAVSQAVRNLLRRQRAGET